MKNSGIKYWIIVACCCLIAASSVGIVVNAVGVFYTPVSTALGVSQGTFTLHATCCLLATALTALFVPQIIKRVPIKLMVLIGVSLTSLSTFAMGLSHHIILFYILGIIRGIGAAMYGAIPVTIIINNWIYKQNGLATSITFCFSGVGGAVLSPVFTNLIESIGWENTYFVVAILTFVLVLPFLLFPFKMRPEDEGRLPYGKEYESETNISVKELQLEDETKFKVLQPKFIIFFIIAIVLNAITAMSSHLPTYALSIGFSATLGSLMLSATMIGNICSKFIIGILSDMIGIMKSVYTMIIINMLALIIFMLFKTEYTLLIAAFLFGAIYSVCAVGLAIMTRIFFGSENYSSSYSWITFGCNFGAAFAVTIIGYIYDFTASYSLIFVIGLVIAILAITGLNIVKRMKTV
ncbi:MAG: MFS transporter [Erysipelotrichaceae bacterium]|nr:MFS transporter [Erysipelotrichaceae bacterium]